MRFLIKICSSVVLMLLCINAHADEHFPFTAKVTRPAVNIRAGSNTNFEKIDQLKENDTVIVLARQFDWFKIQLPKTAKAYMRSDYLKMHDGLVAEIIGDKVHVRAKPDAESSTLGLLTQGTLVNVIEVTQGWAKLVPGAGMSGWVHQDFISKTSDSADPSLIYQPISPSPQPVTSSP